MLSQFLKAHERLILALAALLFLAGATWKLLGYLEHRDQKQYDSKLSELQSQISANQQLATQAQQDKAAYAALVVNLQAQIAALSSQINARNVQLVKQQATDITLPLSDLSTHWEQLLELPPKSIIPNDAGGIAVNESAARETVKALDELPVAVENWQDEKKIIVAKDAELDAQGKLVADLNKQVAGLQAESADKSKTCDAQVKLLKAQARKSKLKWFIGGVITGFVAKIILGH